MNDFVILIWTPLLIIGGLAIWGVLVFLLWAFIAARHDAWHSRTVRR